MVRMTPPEAALESFGRRAARLLGTPIDRVVLFGSRARGDVHAGSDTDLLVVSNGFEGMSFIRRAALVRSAWPMDVPVDIVCFTPEEYQERRGRPSIVQLAEKEGRSLPVL